MRDVQQIATEIIRREGGFVNDPSDPGGPTKFGVTIHTMRRLGLDLNRDGTVDIKDVREITQDQARDIFIDHYFEAPGIARLPAPIHATVFDMYVNSGSNAVRILQQMLVDMGFDLSVDGIIGPLTIKACFGAFDMAPDYFVDAYGIARRNYYYRLADNRAASRKYARRRDGGKGGWIKRAEEFISKAYHLTATEHRERVAKWG